MKQNSNKTTRTIVFGTCCLLLGAFLVYSILYKFPRVINETVTKIERDITVTDEGIADAVEKVYDSTVIIGTYKKDTKFSSGSGFVYKVDGNKTYIITNHHVINDGDKFEISFTDGSKTNARLLGSDQYRDIAVLEIESKENLKSVVLGKTDSLRVGDTTFTVGAPLDDVYSWSVTRGIISGKERYVEVSLSNSYGDEFIMNVLQTDAAVNSGNSGGPLSNSNGEVIGVINAKIKSSGVEGMGFAIPIENAIEKAEQIIKGEDSEYPYLGASMVNVEDAKTLPQMYSYVQNINVTEGVIIYAVEKNSGAENANLQKGDVITKINDNKISNMAYLRYELYKYKIGDTINVTFFREGKERVVSVKLTSRNISM